MARILDGRELSGFIKERQAKEVRRMRQADHIIPKLAIITTGSNPVIDTYVRLKKVYGDDILVEVSIHVVEQPLVKGLIQQLNEDVAVHGIVLQVPITDPSETDALIAEIAERKDVDALNENSPFDGATATAINWLLAGYNIELAQKKIVLIGNGRLVGQPLAAMWRSSGLDVTIIDIDTNEIEKKTIIAGADIIVTAVGQPNLLTSDAIPIGCVVVDAATTNENGKLVGDVSDDARERSDITITPLVGGVGPLTITALFDNVLRAASKK